MSDPDRPPEPAYGDPTMAPEMIRRKAVEAICTVLGLEEFDAIVIAEKMARVPVVPVAEKPFDGEDARKALDEINAYLKSRVDPSDYNKAAVMESLMSFIDEDEELQGNWQI